MQGRREGEVDDGEGASGAKGRWQGAINLIVPSRVAASLDAVTMLRMQRFECVHVCAHVSSP